MKEKLPITTTENNVIAESATGAELYVQKEGEKLELTSEEKVQIPQKIEEAKIKHDQEIARIQEKYKSRVGQNDGKNVTEEKIRDLGIKRAKENYESKVKYLNSLK